MSAIDTAKPSVTLADFIVEGENGLGVPFQVHFGLPTYNDYVQIKNESNRTLRIVVQEVHLIPDTAEYDSW